MVREYKHILYVLLDLLGTEFFKEKRNNLIKQQQQRRQPRIN